MMSADVKRALGAIATMLAFGGSFLVAGFVGGWHGVSTAAPNTSLCERVNGNTDGTPCIDQDSRGRWHADDSSDYRPRRRG